jgi:predicted transposase YbfD/YdcC
LPGLTSSRLRWRDSDDLSYRAHPLERASRHLAMDGKTLRGSLKSQTQAQGGKVHLLELYEVEKGLVLAQQQVNAKSNELTCAPKLVEGFDLAGCIVSADALHTQKKWCRQIQKQGGDWLLIAKANQARLRAEIAFLFEGEDWPGWLEKREAQTVDKAHGRLEVRHLTVSSELKELLAGQWSGTEQVFKLERHITQKGVTHQEVVYGLTSLPTSIAGPAQLLALVRRHWAIENRLHWRKDVTLREDSCLIANVQVQQVLANLNNAVLALMDQLKVNNVPAQRQGFAANPAQALALLVSNIIL